MKNDKKKIKNFIDSLISISKKLNKNSKESVEYVIMERFNNELKDVNEKTHDKIKKYISSINQLSINRDYCKYIQNYFLEKENIVKDTYSSEFVWLWNLRKKIVKNILEKNIKTLIDKNEFSEPVKNNFENETKTMVSVVEFVVENNIILNDKGNNKEIKNRNDDKKIK